MTKIEELRLLGYVDDVAKVDITPMNADQQKAYKATCYHQETTRGTSCRAPSSNVIQLFSVTLEDMPSQEN